MKFRLFDYILPSVVSMVIVGTNANVDGIFIGALLGDDGLAAINIIWPIVAFIAATGTGAGVGGGVIFSGMCGKGCDDKAEAVKNTTLLLMGAASVLITVVLLLFYTRLLSLMGARGNVLRLAEEYGVIIVSGAIAQIFGSGVLVLLRNDGKAYKGMMFSVAGVAIHLLLDIFLTKELGMYGVAFATVFSQMVVAIMGLSELHIDKGAGICIGQIKTIICNSIAPLGLNFVPSFVLMFTNFFAMMCGRVAAVSAYAVMCYVVYTFDYVFQGVCDGVQPIISYCTGSGDKTEKKNALKASAAILLIMSVCFAVLTPLLIYIMVRFFAISDNAKLMVKSGLVIYMFSYPFKAAVKYICSYYYASGKTLISNILVYLDPLLLTPLLLLLLSRLMGINGVWLSMTLSQIIISMIGLMIFSLRRIKNE